MIPNRMDRRLLDSERSLGSLPILPSLGEVRHTMILRDDRKLSAWDFQVSPGVLETDYVFEPEIDAYLMYSTILPRDE